MFEEVQHANHTFPYLELSGLTGSRLVEDVLVWMIDGFRVGQPVSYAMSDASTPDSAEVYWQSMDYGIHGHLAHPDLGESA